MPLLRGRLWSGAEQMEGFDCGSLHECAFWTEVGGCAGQEGVAPRVVEGCGCGGGSPCGG